MKTNYLYFSFFLALITSQSVLADEVWNTNYGKVVYEKEIGTTALWSYSANGVPGLIYIDNLAGVYKGRGYYQGYWVQTTSGSKCSTQRMMQGTPSYYWGQFQIQFLDPNYPSRWEAKWSYCEQQPTAPWKGTPVTN